MLALQSSSEHSLDRLWGHFGSANRRMFCLLVPWSHGRNFWRRQQALQQCVGALSQCVCVGGGDTESGLPRGFPVGDRHWGKVPGQKHTYTERHAGVHPGVFTLLKEERLSLSSPLPPSLPPPPPPLHPSHLISLFTLTSFR